MEAILLAVIYQKKENQIILENNFLIDEVLFQLAPFHKIESIAEVFGEPNKLCWYLAKRGSLVKCRMDVVLLRENIPIEVRMLVIGHQHSRQFRKTIVLGAEESIFKRSSQLSAFTYLKCFLPQ